MFLSKHIVFAKNNNNKTDIFLYPIILRYEIAFRKLKNLEILKIPGAESLKLWLEHVKMHSSFRETTMNENYYLKDFETKINKFF